MFKNISPNEKINSLNHLADSLFTMNPDKSLEFSEQALQLSEYQKNDQGKLKAMVRIADIYWGKTDLEKALDYASKAKELAILLGNQREYAESLLIIAKIYTDLGDYDKSSELNFEALKVFENEKDKAGVLKALGRIGYIFFDQRKWTKALEYDSISLSIAREINDLSGIARGLNNVAAVYANMGEYDNFEKNIREAIVINKKTGQKLWVGINYLNLGINNRERMNLDTAFFYLKKAEAIFKELNNIPKLTATYLSISRYYSQVNDFKNSLNYANLAYKRSKESNLKKWVYESAKRLHKIYKIQNDIPNAYKYSTIEYQMKDSLNIEQSLTRLSQLELLHKLEKENQEKKIIQQRKNYILIISVTILIAVFVLIIIILIARQRLKAKNEVIKRQELENELEIRNKELASNVMALMKKNEILSDIADKLMIVRDDAVKEETKIAIKRIARELEKTTDDEIWEEFEVRFRQVHSDFYDKLLEQFPNLSPNEQRLCAFLRLNMTTKEISELTGQRIATIEIARSRLRKKLKINNTKVNLVTFLSQI